MNIFRVLDNYCQAASLVKLYQCISSISWVDGRSRKAWVCFGSVLLIVILSAPRKYLAPRGYSTITELLKIIDE